MKDKKFCKKVQEILGCDSKEPKALIDRLAQQLQLSVECRVASSPELLKEFIRDYVERFAHEGKLNWNVQEASDSKLLVNLADVLTPGRLLGDFLPYAWCERVMPTSHVME